MEFLGFPISDTMPSVFDQRTSSDSLWSRVQGPTRILATRTSPQMLSAATCLGSAMTAARMLFVDFTVLTSGRNNFLNVVIISFLWQDMRNINSITLILILFTDGIVTALNFVLILLNLKDDFGAKFTPLLLEHLAILMVPR